MTLVRVMTWNIHGALGRNPRFDVARVVEFVRKHQPDIVALQEIDSRRVRSDGVGDPFELLQDKLGKHGIGARAITTADGDYGQALISRWPLLGADVRDLSWQKREPRRAIACDVATPFGPLRVLATHLGLSLKERRHQASTLLGMLGKMRGPTVALGDFNDWLWTGSVQRTLARALPGVTRHRTFPASMPLFQLDRVYVFPRTALAGSRTDATARALSDHLPVIADISLAE